MYTCIYCLLSAFLLCFDVIQYAQWGVCMCVYVGRKHVSTCSFLYIMYEMLHNFFLASIPHTFTLFLFLHVHAMDLLVTNQR